MNPSKWKNLKKQRMHRVNQHTTSFLFLKLAPVVNVYNVHTDEISQSDVLYTDTWEFNYPTDYRS